MKYFSMFSGIGGFEYGIQNACNKQFTQIKQDRQGRNGDADEVGHNVLPTSRESTLCVGYSEVDKYAIKVYERNFNESLRCLQSKDNEIKQNSNNTSNKLQQRKLSNNRRKHINYGDATKINPKKLPDFDLLVGGFPCQAFSIAGKRNGFNDTRGTLFFDIARILAEKRPRHLVLENVKGLLSHDSGKTFQTILGVLSDLGYRVEWQVLNSKDFGVPQNRERIYFVGHLRGECGGKVFPITGTNQQTFESNKIIVPRKHRTETNLQNISSTLTSTFRGQPDGDGRPAVAELKQLVGGSQGNRVYSTDGVSSTLASQAGGLGAKTGLYAIANTLDANYYKGNSKSGTRHTPRTEVLDNSRIRRLTPLECERLQGFPDNWTAGESDTQRYKMCGNAVTVNVVEAVITGLLNEQ